MLDIDDVKEVAQHYLQQSDTIKEYEDIIDKQANTMRTYDKAELKQLAENSNLKLRLARLSKENARLRGLIKEMLESGPTDWINDRQKFKDKFKELADVSKNR